MSDNRDAKRDALRTRLIEAAESELAEHGMQGLKARNVTKKAGCALGGLYNVVPDLDGLIILVNSKTLARLGGQLQDAVPSNASPQEAIQQLAQAYVIFAMAEPHLWFAAFNHRLPEGQELPLWHQEEYMILTQNIAMPLAKLVPDLSLQAAALRAQTLFAAVHGVVHMSLNGQFAGAPRDHLQAEIKALVTALTRGMRPNSTQPDQDC